MTPNTSNILKPLIQSSITSVISTSFEKKLPTPSLYKQFARKKKPVFELNEKGQITRWNKWMEQHTGFSKTEAKNKVFFQTFLIGDTQKAWTLFQKEINKKSNQSFVCQIQTKQPPIDMELTFIKDDNREPSRILVLGTDLTQQRTKKYEQEVSKEMWRTVVTAVPDFITTLNQSGKIMFANRVQPDFTVNQMVETNFFKYVNPSEVKKFKTVLSTLFKTGKSAEFETFDVRIYGKKRWYLTRMAPVYQDNTIVAATLISTDITQSRKIKQDLLKSEKRYRLIAENSTDIIGQMSLDSPHLFVSPSVLNILGYELEERKDRKMLELVHPEDRALLLQNIRQVKSEKEVTFTLRAKQKSGNYIWLEAHARYVEDPDDPEKGHVLFVSRDVSDRRQVVDKLKESLKEKEIMLKEIHHRVKNNMQIISSMLNIQSHFFSDEKAKIVFRECQNRIKSMALIHETLYQSQNFAYVDFKLYTQKLVDRLIRTYKVDINNIQLKMTIPRIQLGIDCAIPCALILNELVSNAIEHGFENKKTGTISVSMIKKIEEEYQYYHLTVHDNGDGFPKHIDLKNSVTMGLQLVSTLASQLNGEIELDKTNGTTVKLIFKEIIKTV